MDDAAGPAQRQQVVDQGAEAAAGLDQVVDVLAALVAQRRGVVLGQEVAERLQRAQRLLEVVRDDVGEVLQFLVDAAQLVVGLSNSSALAAGREPGGCARSGRGRRCASGRSGPCRP